MQIFLKEKKFFVFIYNLYANKSDIFCFYSTLSPKIYHKRRPHDLRLIVSNSDDCNVVILSGLLLHMHNRLFL